VWNSFYEWVASNYMTILLVGALVLLVLAVVGVAIYDRRASIKAYLAHRRELRIRRGIAMGRKDKANRQAYVKGLLADAITNGLEEAWFAGKITEEERNDCYRMIGKTHHIPDLLPSLSNATLKAMIKGRRALGNSGGSPAPKQDAPAWGDAPPVPVRNDNVIDAKKVFGAKALELLKTG
jgi:hypothetical protein